MVEEMPNMPKNPIERIEDARNVLIEKENFLSR